jgi:two-component system, LytTR family, sensor kinase
MNVTTGKLSFIRKNLAAILLLLMWVIVAVVVYVQSTIAMWLNCEPSDRYTVMIICCGWLFWSLLTPFILAVTKKIDSLKLKLQYQIPAYLGLSLLFVSLHIFLQMLLYNIAFDHQRSAYHLPDYIIYHIHTQFVVFFFIVFSMKGIRFYKSYLAARIKEEKLNSELSNARLSALKMQLNPHFLFNTHHSIISSMTKNDNKKATEMLLKLSDFLRITLDNNSQVGSVAEELRLVHLYLDIQKIRLGDKLTVNIDMEPGVEQAAIPTFILQPLIENAIIHGIAPYSQSAVLAVQGRRVDDRLEISIHDTGRGIGNQPVTEGIGLSNTRGRLKELYNDKAGLSVKPHPERGTVTKVWLPFFVFNPTTHAAH